MPPPTPPPAPYQPFPPQTPRGDYDDGLGIEVETPAPAHVTPSSGPTVPLGSSHPAAPDEVGKTCPYCRFPLKPGEPVITCPACKLPHHADCWTENRGCTTYGCQSSPQVGGAQPVTGVAQQPGMAVAPGGYQAQAYGGDLPRAARALLEQELDRLATNALIFSLLWFLCGIPALIGLLTGISVLGQVKQSGLVASGAKKKAWIAIGISSAVLVALIIWIVNLIGNG